MQFIKLFLISLLAFIPVDLIWLAYIGRPIYIKYIGHHMSDSPDWLAAITFYVIFLLGLVFFVVQPSLDDSFLSMLAKAAFYGLITYGTYELTNKAVINNWPWPIVWIDIAWGMLLCMIVASASWYFGRKF
jgi:uncharacterized membrane protein